MNTIGIRLSLLILLFSGCRDTATVPIQAIKITSLNSGTNQNIHGVYFIDQNTGFVVGDSGTILNVGISG